MIAVFIISAYIIAILAQPAQATTAAQQVTATTAAQPGAGPAGAGPAVQPAAVVAAQPTTPMTIAPEASVVVRQQQQQQQQQQQPPSGEVQQPTGAMSPEVATSIAKATQQLPPLPDNVPNTFTASSSGQSMLSPVTPTHTGGNPRGVNRALSMSSSASSATTSGASGEFDAFGHNEDEESGDGAPDARGLAGSNYMVPTNWPPAGYGMRD